MEHLNVPTRGVEKKAAATSKAAAAVNTTTLFAVVNQDGTLARGAGATSSQNFGDGYYEVIFDRDVSQGAYVATIGFPGDSGTAPAGIVTVVGRITTDAGVWIATYDTNGNRVSQSFHLSVVVPS